MPKLLVVFYSRTGNTARLADAIAEGAGRIRFTEVDVRRLDDLAPAEVIDGIPSWREARDRLAARYRTLESAVDLAQYDAVVFGSPTRYGVMAAELSRLLEQAAELQAQGLFDNKVGSAFTSVQLPQGGHETTVWSIMTPLANLGMILVPPCYVGLTEASEMDAARSQGERMARVAGWVTHGLGHEAEGAHHHHGHHHHH